MPDCLKNQWLIRSMLIFNKGISVFLFDKKKSLLSFSCNIKFFPFLIAVLKKRMLCSAPFNTTAQSGHKNEKSFSIQGYQLFSSFFKWKNGFTFPFPKEI